MSENVFEMEAKMPNNLPPRPWGIGERRPAFTLALGTEDMVLAMKAAVSLGGLAALGGSQALKHWAGIYWPSNEIFFIWTIIAANYLAAPACVAMEQWLARSGSSARWSAALHAGRLSVQISLLEFADSLHMLGSLVRLKLLGFAKKNVRLAPSSCQAKAGSLAPQKSAAPANSKLAIRLANLKSHLSACRKNPEGLSEKGAWRLARHFAAKDMPVEAAQVWLATPFNPDWGIVAVGERFLARVLFGAGAPFGDWVALSAGREPDGSKAKFLSDASGLMAAAKDGLAIAEASAAIESAKPNPVQKMRL